MKNFQLWWDYFTARYVRFLLGKTRQKNGRSDSTPVSYDYINFITPPRTHRIPKYSCVHISSDTAFYKILKKPSILQK